MVDCARASLAVAVALAAAAVVLSSGSQDSGRTAEAAGGIAFKELDHGTRPGSGESETRRGRVLRTETGARRVLRGWDLDRAVEAVEPVDFARRSLLVVLDSSRSSAGYRLRVVRVDVRNRRAIVTATVRRAEGMYAQVISRPYALLSIARRSLARATRGVVVRLQG